jgi:hypothetical protein
MPKVMPLGYADPATEQIVKSLMAGDDHWLLIDIRKENVAGRWFPLWSGKYLNILYHGRYLHAPELGNLNYKDKSLPIKLANPEAGLERLRREMAMGHNLILLCACKYYEKQVTRTRTQHCHRKDVVELIVAAMPGVEVVMPEVIYESV